MLGRFTKQTARLGRSFADYIYTANVEQAGLRNVTLIPGTYIGPETTSTPSPNQNP